MATQPHQASAWPWPAGAVQGREVRAITSQPARATGLSRDTERRGYHSNTELGGTAAASGLLTRPWGAGLTGIWCARRRQWHGYGSD